MANIEVGNQVRVSAYGTAWTATVTRVDPNWGEHNRALNIYVTSPDGQGRCLDAMVRRGDTQWQQARGSFRATVELA
jgi:hypothetical protein